MPLILLVGIAIVFIVIAVRNHNEEEDRRYREIQVQEREQKLKQEEEGNEFWKKLERLNSQYALAEIQDSYHLISWGMFNFEKKTNTSDLFYSDEKRKAYLTGKIFAYYDWFSTFVQITNENLKKFEEYKIKVDVLYAQCYQNPNEKSAELLARKMIKKPSFPNIHLVVKKGTYLGYGETKYENREFSYNFLDIYELVLDKKGKNDFVKEERAKMSDSLRYNVLCRDNFCCVLCGKSRKDGVSLEIDHIIPVSKGGRTELDNLQTLCERCNRGKRDEMPANIPVYTHSAKVASKPMLKPTISQERTSANSPTYYHPSMEYKLCPICQLNMIKEDEEKCNVCGEGVQASYPKLHASATIDLHYLLKSFYVYCKTPGVDSGKAQSYVNAIQYLCDFLGVHQINEQIVAKFKSLEIEIYRSNNEVRNSLLTFLKNRRQSSYLTGGFIRAALRYFYPFWEEHKDKY